MVQITSLDFGPIVPEVELIDLRAIYRDFPEDDDEHDDDRDSVKVTKCAGEEVGLDGVRGEPQGEPATLVPHIIISPRICTGGVLPRTYFSRLSTGNVSIPGTFTLSSTEKLTAFVHN